MDAEPDADTGYAPDHFTFKLMWTCKVAGGCEESETADYFWNVYAQSDEGWSLYFSPYDVYFQNVRGALLHSLTHAEFASAGL